MGEQKLISLGAPQVIEKFDELESPEQSSQFKDDITAAAKDGFRVLAVATKTGDGEEKGMMIVGLIYLTDPLDDTSKDTVAFMIKHGIDVKMVTGDNRVIAGRITEELNLSGQVMSAEETREFYGSPDTISDKLPAIAAFSEILPKDKYELVKASKQHYIVASTGDGINDLPALKVANVGIAVAGAVSALKSLADIVLLGHGLGLIQDAILESRKIFVRLYNYSVYRISESFRLIITILVLGLWYGYYPLIPLQIIILAFLNDIPIIALAVDKVKVSLRPAEVKVKQRLTLSILFGFVGVLNSLILFYLMENIWHLPLATIQTMFFLKLTISGHLLVFVVHTKERWWKFLPAKSVMIAIFATQGVATLLAVTGLFMPASISIGTAIFLWIWSFFWMQVGEVTKYLQARFLSTDPEILSTDDEEVK
jgi:H+-transporting ATPase